MEAEESEEARRTGAEQKLRRQVEEEEWQRKAEEERSRLVSDKPLNGAIKNNKQNGKKRSPLTFWRKRRSMRVLAVRNERLANLISGQI